LPLALPSKMSNLYVLYEHAAGYALFKVREFEEAGAFLPQVEQSVTDLSRFNSVVKLMGFSPFKSAAHALENMNAVSEGVLTDDLRLFLETNLPKDDVVLGVIEPNLGAAINEMVNINCQHTGVVPEVVRGIRCHFASMIKGFTPQSASVAQLGLGHSYSRAKVKFNVHRADNMIIQSIALLDQLDKDINTFAMRIREWYSYHFPELVKIVPDNYAYARCAQMIGDRKQLTAEKIPELEEFLMDSSRAVAIVDAAKMSMGMDISPIDLINIERFAKRVIGLAEYRLELAEYLKSKMHQVAPNLATLIGEQVGARLISHAGSLTNLAKYPASTVQILGAEKALFRALKTRGNTPKYGLIFHSTFIGRAGAKNKGRISRYLANKCSIATRIDCFNEAQTDVFGKALRDQVEERLKFYEDGELPRKNVDVMCEAVKEAEEVFKSLSKKKKKKKKRESEAGLNGTLETTHDESVAAETPGKKKKKQEMEGEEEPVENGVEAEETPGKKKKKKKRVEEADESNIADESMQQEMGVDEPVKKKKKKKKSAENED